MTDKEKPKVSVDNASTETNETIAAEVKVVQKTPKPIADLFSKLAPDALGMIERSSQVNVRTFRVPEHTWNINGKDYVIPDYTAWIRFTDSFLTQLATMYAALPEYAGLGLEGVKEKMKFFLGREYCTRDHVQRDPSKPGFKKRV